MPSRWSRSRRRWSSTASVIKEARLALGGVAHKPWRDPAAEAALRGQPANAGSFAQRRRSAAARRQGLRAQRLQDRPGAPRHRPRADAGRGTARRNRNPTRKSGEQERPMTTYIGTATSRVDGRAKVTGAAKYAGRVQRARPRPWPASCHRRSPRAASRASTRARRLRVDGVLDVLTHENRPRMAGRRQRLQGRCGAGGLAVPAALRRQDPVQRPADRAGRGRRTRRPRASRRRWSASNTTRKRTSRTCTASATTPSRSKPARRHPFARRSRAATPRRPSPRPRCATRPNITSRSSITTRWSCMPRR